MKVIAIDRLRIRINEEKLKVTDIISQGLNSKHAKRVILLLSFTAGIVKAGILKQIRMNSYQLCASPAFLVHIMNIFFTF